MEAAPGGLWTERTGQLLVLDELSSGFAQSSPANLQGWESLPLWGASPLLHSRPANGKKEQVGMSATLHAAPSGTSLGHGVMANTIDVRAWWRKMGHNRCSHWPLHGRPAAGTAGMPDMFLGLLVT